MFPFILALLLLFFLSECYPYIPIFFFLYKFVSFLHPHCCAVQKHSAFSSSLTALHSLDTQEPQIPELCSVCNSRNLSPSSSQCSDQPALIITALPTCYSEDKSPLLYYRGTRTCRYILVGSP